MTKRHILFLIPLLPYPPNQGGALRYYGIMRGLARRGHTVSLATFRTPDQPEAKQTPLVDLCQHIITQPAPERSKAQRLVDLLGGHADLERRFWSEPMQTELITLLQTQHFDVIHMGIEMAAYLPALSQYAPDTLIVYDALNAEYELQRRIAQQDLRSLRRLPLGIYSLIQSRRLHRVETKLCRAAGHIFACSAVDAEKLAALPHTTPISVVPNAISVQNYTVGEHTAHDLLQHPVLVFTGKMDYRPNVDAVLWFASDILPLIRAVEPGVHFTIVGQRPHERLNALRENPAITLTGFVEDIQPYISEADVYVVPLRMGSGTRFKLLESMALGSAIVSTRIGAEGLAVEHEKHLLLADSAPQFAEAVLRLLHDDDLQNRLKGTGRQLISERYDWQAIIPDIEAGYSAGKGQ